MLKNKVLNIPNEFAEKIEIPADDCIEGLYAAS